MSVSEIVVPLHADYYQGGQKMPSMHVRIACSLARQSSSVKACKKSELVVKTKRTKKQRMDTLSYKTISINKATAKKEWVVVDATDQVLGRLCTKVAKLLRGKYKPEFTPNVDCGDNVIIVNAEKIRLTGKKMTDRIYYSYTGYPGGQREATPASILAKPNGADKLLRKTVKGMLPKNKLADRLLNNLYIYEGAEHKQQAQSPKAIDINLYK